MLNMKPVKLSVVIPVYNEEENVPRLYPLVKETLEGMGQSYEILFVNDGSCDGTSALLDEIQKEDERVVVVHLRRNFGQTAALSAGFDFAQGELVVTMDGDLQNDPGDIPRLCAASKDFDLVSGWRTPRQDPFFRRRLPSVIANWLISRVTGVKLHDYGCTLKAYRREVLTELRLYGEMHRFIPAVASWMGVRIGEIKVRHHPRRYGKSKYGLGRIVKVLLDLLTVKFLLSYSTRPAQMFGPLGLAVGGAGFLISLYLTVLKLVTGAHIGDRPLLMLGILFIILGAQLLLMGFLGELVVRVYYESQGKPIYVVRRVLRKETD